MASQSSLAKGAPRQRCPPRGPTSERHCDRCGAVFGPLGIDYDCCTKHSTRMCMTCDCPECIPLTAEEEEGIFRSHQPSAPAWIAVEARLPEYDDCEDILAMDYRGNISSFKTDVFLTLYEDGMRSYTHWMDANSLRALLPPTEQL